MVVCHSPWNVTVTFSSAAKAFEMPVIEISIKGFVAL